MQQDKTWVLTPVNIQRDVIWERETAGFTAQFVCARLSGTCIDFLQEYLFFTVLYFLLSFFCNAILPTLQHHSKLTPCHFLPQIADIFLLLFLWAVFIGTTDLVFVFLPNGTSFSLNMMISDAGFSCSDWFNCRHNTVLSGFMSL